MSTAAPAPDEPASDTTDSPDARTLWRYSRGPLAALLVIILTGGIVAIFGSRDSGALDPTAATPDGSRALAELLDDEGVTTTLTTTADETTENLEPGATLLVALPDAVSPSRLAELQETVTTSGGRLVLVAPTDTSLAATAPGTTAQGPAPPEETTPGCPAEEAQRARSATLGGYLFQLPDNGAVNGTETVTACYETDGLPSLAVLDHDPGETVLLGTPAPLLNEHLADHGNASLTLQLLGNHPELTWYLPSPSDAPAAEDEQDPLSLLPDGWRWAAIQLGIAVALAAAWRMRRLGPLVTERLPVRIRAAETTEGRARLYHRAGARDRAADALRSASRHRLASFTGVPISQAHQALTTAVATQTGDRPQAVHELLYGAPPADDRALVRLADQLDALERRIGPAAAGAPRPDDRHGTGNARDSTRPTEDPPTEDSSP